MSVQQISVFLESQPGHLRRVLDAFEDAHVSVRGYSASDTGDYGIVRFIVDAPDKALAVLRDMGAAATSSDVLCARLDDTPKVAEKNTVASRIDPATLAKLKALRDRATGV